jgi:GTP-binding protein
MYEFLKHYNRPVTVIATKSDKVKNSERSKNKKLIIETLKLTENDRLIITSSEKREGFGLVMQMLDDVVGKHDEYLASLPEEEIDEE